MTPIRILSEDLVVIATWREARGLPHWPERWLSPTGYWVPGLAAGWLIATDTGRAYLEDIIANPGADPAEYGRALFAVERTIAAEARSRGYLYLMGTTMLEPIRERVKIAGYSVSEAHFSWHSKRLQ